MTWLLRLDTATSVLTLATMWLLSEGHGVGWLVGLVNQALWIALIHRRRLWGLVPLTLCITVIYARAVWRWSLW